MMFKFLVLMFWAPCKIDYQCLHWYDIGFSGLQTYLEENHDQFGLPILLTEFADQVLPLRPPHTAATARLLIPYYES